MDSTPHSVTAASGLPFQDKPNYRNSTCQHLHVRECTCKKPATGTVERMRNHLRAGSKFWVLKSIESVKAGCLGCGSALLAPLTIISASLRVAGTSWKRNGFRSSRTGSTRKEQQCTRTQGKSSTHLETIVSGKLETMNLFPILVTWVLNCRAPVTLTAV